MKWGWSFPILSVPLICIPIGFISFGKLISKDGLIFLAAFSISSFLRLPQLKLGINVNPFLTSNCSVMTRLLDFKRMG